MTSQNPQESAKSAMKPISVALMAVHGAHAPDIADDMRRNVLQIAAYQQNVLPGDDFSIDVAIVWLPELASEEQLTKVVAWAEGRATPIGLIGCTPRGSREAAEAGLSVGFDDFVIGAVSPREFAARARALVRRIRISTNNIDRRPFHGDISLDLDRHRLWLRGEQISLTRTEMAVMAALVNAQGHTISRAEILDAAWSELNFDVSERAVDNVVMRLRRKFGADDVISTIRGIGFRLADI